MIASMDDISKRTQYVAGGALRLTVKDEGPGEIHSYTAIFTNTVTDNAFFFAGLTADNLKKLFGEGVQFNANKLQGGGGSGLGLWIAKG